MKCMIFSKMREVEFSLLVDFLVLQNNENLKLMKIIP